MRVIDVGVESAGAFSVTATQLRQRGNPLKVCRGFGGGKRGGKLRLLGYVCAGLFAQEDKRHTRRASDESRGRSARLGREISGE